MLLGNFLVSFRPRFPCAHLLLTQISIVSEANAYQNKQQRAHP